MIAAIIIVFTHDVALILTKPFWIDELWVALSVNFPVADLPQLTSSTPIGWNAVQRLFAPLGEQAQRLLPLIFSWQATIVAYFIGYIAWTAPRLVKIATGIFVSASVTFMPLMLSRNDLKQYTADVFFALLFLVLVVHIVRTKSSKALYVLTFCTATSLMFSVASVFPAMSAFAALVISALIRREFRAMWCYSAFGAVAGVSMVALYFGFYRVALNTSLSQSWAAYFPLLFDLPRYISMRIGEIVGVYGFAGRWGVVLVLANVLGAFGVLAWRDHNRAMAFYPFILCGLMCIVGVLQFYPLLDKRTSLFLWVTIVAITALTLARLATLVSGTIRGGRWNKFLLPSFFLIAMAVVVGIGAPSLRAHLPLREDARSQINFIRHHMHNGDVIVTDQFGALALAYYWPGLHAQWVPCKLDTTGFRIVFSAESGVFVTTDESLVGQISAAATRQRSETVWFIVTHRKGGNSPAFVEFGKFKALANVSTRQIDVGSEPLYTVEVASLRQGTTCR